MTVQNLISRIKNSPESINFDEVMACISEHYDYTPARFSNGAGTDTVINDAGSNEGSCKIFAFGKLEGLTEAETLACFGHYYRDEVLQHPEAANHANIRTFIKYGWGEIKFDSVALTGKTDI